LPPFPNVLQENQFGSFHLELPPTECSLEFGVSLVVHQLRPCLQNLGALKYDSLWNNIQRGSRVGTEYQGNRREYVLKLEDLDSGIAWGSFLLG
jgi:hypothetical protein